MTQGSLFCESTDSFTHQLLRPWSFAAQSSGNDARVDEINSGEPFKEPSSKSAWCRYPSHLRRSFEAEPTIKPSGWWNHQMLFDRSLRSMAALMTLYAVIMTTICAAYLKDFVHRDNPHSTSVGQNKGKSCTSLQGTEIMIQLVMNIAATTILGMSNSYQQLITSLDIGEIRWALSKFGDCRVGTNSPSTINRKQSGRIKSWLAWILLISTSIPIHFFANSVIGPSVYLMPPRNIRYIPVSNSTEFAGMDTTYASKADDFPSNSEMLYADMPGSFDVSPEDDEACWVVFRTGVYSPWSSPTTRSSDDNGDSSDTLEAMQYSSIDVSYIEQNCSAYVNRSDYTDLQHDQYSIDTSGTVSFLGIGDCGEQSVICRYYDKTEQQCRLSIRMSAAFILTVCLIIKATYMISVNFQGRRRKKTQCLTFGDVVVASSMDPDLVIQGECMVNAGEAYRNSTDHKCHKHCKTKTPSKSGDELGHCQKCRKYNENNKAANLTHPCIATKYKKSLLSNLGSTALTQMITLSLCSTAMLAASSTLAVFFGIAATLYKYSCAYPDGYTQAGVSSKYTECVGQMSHYLAQKFGSFGGFESTAAIGNLPMDKASSEVLAFAISNGAQLLYSLLYLLLIYNLTLISMEYDWGNLEKRRARLRCTLVRGAEFRQSYLLQLPKAVLYPMMAFSSVMHWLLGQAISTKEIIWAGDLTPGHPWEHSQYSVVYGTYAIWLSTVLMVVMTGTCWWVFTYTREGFIPQMYGSIRVCCAATTELGDYTDKGVQWGDLGMGDKFRHAGFSAYDTAEIVPAELYADRRHLETRRACGGARVHEPNLSSEDNI